jgi:SAM domain (Sterile alpha motif)
MHRLLLLIAIWKTFSRNWCKSNKEVEPSNTSQIRLMFFLCEGQWFAKGSGRFAGGVGGFNPPLKRFYLPSTRQLKHLNISHKLSSWLPFQNFDKSMTSCIKTKFSNWQNYLCFDSGRHNLDLEQLAELFVEHCINGNRLLKLTRENLRDMGITSVGHIKELLVCWVATRSPLLTVGDSSVSSSFKFWILSNTFVCDTSLQLKVKIRVKKRTNKTDFGTVLQVGKSRNAYGMEVVWKNK